MAWIRSKFLGVMAPVATAGLLMGAAYFERGWPARADAEPYHQRAAEAIARIPLKIGPWVGKEAPPQQAVMELLKPNAIRKLEYLDPSTAALGRPGNRVALSVVQTKRSVDMLGHYPPNCYTGLGDQLMKDEHRTWVVNRPGSPAGAAPLQIPGVEYCFDRVIRGNRERRIVYNFMVAPKRGVLPDMKRLEEAAEDYEQRYCGAAQFQVVFWSLADQELSQAERDRIFVTLMAECATAIDVLSSGR